MANNKLARRMRNQDITLTENEGTILYLRNHPTLAARVLLGIKLNWIQRISLKAVWYIPFVMLVLGRRNGKTFVGAIVCILRAMLFPNEKIMIIAPSKRQVDFIFLNEIQPLFNESDYFKGSVKGKVVITNSYNRIVFHNGSVVQGFPVGNAGDKIRGAGANFLWIDEYASMSESIINLVLRPMLFTKKKGEFNRYLITSSAYYRWNHLWTLFQYYTMKMQYEPDKYFVANYNYKHLLLSKNLPVEFDMSILEDAKNTMTETEYIMEWESSFPSESDTFFSSKLVDQCTPKPPDENPIEIETTGHSTSNYYMGIDAARAEGGSNFSISILKHTRGKFHLVHLITANGETFQNMVEMIRRRYVDFNVREIFIDAGGGGTTLKDLLREPWVDPKNGQKLKPLITLDDKIDGIPAITMINITAEVHNNLHMNLKSEMEHKRMLFPMDLRRDSNKELERLGQEIVAFKTELQVMSAKPSGRYLRFEVPAKFRTDRVMSTALALNGILDKSKIVYDTDEFLPVGAWVG